MQKDDKWADPAGRAHARTSPGLARLTALLLGAALTAGAVDAQQPTSLAFNSVPEGQAPQGILAAARASRGSARLHAHPAEADAVRELTAFAHAHWEEIGALDVVGLSRFHVEATRGWHPPAEPHFNGAEVLAADDDALYLMLRGPRLPASFEIVHRYLVFFARYDLTSGQVGDVSVSIRGEVHE
ncbi:MAG: hypothetical protein AAGA68_22075 [Pseudomonadota bacterium]